MRFRLISTLFVFGVALIACSSSSSSTSSPGTTGQTTPTTQTIGPAGGTLSAAGVVLTVPAGALAADTAITITPNAAAIPSGYTGLSQLYAFEPDGTKFATPATIAFTTTSAGTSPTVYWSNDTGSYDALATTVSATGVSAAIQHFSTGFAADELLNVVTDAGNGADTSVTADAGPSAGAINITIDGVATVFSANTKVTLGTGITTIQGDDDASTTHWTIEIVMNGVPQESCVLNGDPFINYTHFTSGAEDELYESKTASGNCTIGLTSNPTNPGDHATGTLTGAVGKSNAPVSDPTTHTFTAGTFDLTL